MGKEASFKGWDVAKKLLVAFRPYYMDQRLILRWKYLNENMKICSLLFLIGLEKNPDKKIQGTALEFKEKDILHYVK